MAYTKSPYDTPSYTGTPVKKKKKVVSPYAGTVTGVNLNTPATTKPSTYNFLSGGGSSNSVTSKPLTITSPFDAQANRVNPTPSYTQTPGVTAKSGYENTLKPPVVTTPVKQETPQYAQPQPQYVQPQPQQQQGQFDYSKISQMIADAFTKNQPKIPEYQPYQNPLNDQILNTLNKIQNYKQFDFDPATNPALQQAQDQAIGRVRQDMARRGRVFDTYAGTQEQQAAQGLIPDYYRLARGDYESDRGYQGQVLGALQGVDQAQYGRYGSEYDRARQGALQGQRDYQTAFDVGQRGAQGEYQRGLTERSYQDQQTQDMENQERAEFKTVLSPQMRDYRQSYLDIPQDMKVKLIQLGNQPGGFATAINQMQPNDPMLPMLQAMRANKVLSDPALLAQYGGEYGMETGAITEMGEIAEQQRAEQVQQKVLNELEVMKEKLQNRKYINEISEIQAQVQKIESESAYKDAQTVVQEYKALQEQIVTAGLPAKLTSEINENISQASANYSRGRASDASARLSGSKTATEEATRQGKKDIQAATIRNKNASTTKLNKEVATKSKTNPALKWVNDNYGKTEYDDDGKSTGKKTLSTLNESEKQRLIESLVDQYNNIENPTTTGKAQVDNIGEVIDIFGMEDEYKKEIGVLVGPLNDKSKWR